MLATLRKYIYIYAYIRVLKIGNNIQYVFLLFWIGKVKLANCHRAGPIPERKGMHAIFQKKGKIFENLGENIQNL